MFSLVYIVLFSLERKFSLQPFMISIHTVQPAPFSPSQFYSQASHKPGREQIFVDQLTTPRGELFFHLDS